MMPIRFESHVEQARFHSPLAGIGEVTQRLEIRRDPLTGRTAIASPELAAKAGLFFGTTDWEFAAAAAARTRPGCVFCPERVTRDTPRYPDELLAGGRLLRGPCILFPNLFPLAAAHAVVTWPEHHYLRPAGFTAELLGEALLAAVEFARLARDRIPGLVQISICANHLPPAGASLFHPHLQVFGTTRAPWLIHELWSRSAEFAARHGRDYWELLAAEEERRGERAIAVEDGWHWLVPFAPAGTREVIALRLGQGRIVDLEPAAIRSLAAGLGRVLAWYEAGGLSAFNFTLAGGPLAPPAGPAGFPIQLRVIARSAFRSDFRADDYFLQRQLGSELIVEPPEESAARLRRAWPAAAAQTEPSP